MRTNESNIDVVHSGKLKKIRILSNQVLREPVVRIVVVPALVRVRQWDRRVPMRGEINCLVSRGIPRRRQYSDGQHKQDREACALSTHFVSTFYPVW